MKKRDKKHAVITRNGDLPGIPPKSPNTLPSLGPISTPAQLYPFIRRTASHLRNLAYNQQRGDGSYWIPRPIDGRYPSAAAILGCIDHLEHMLAERNSLPSYETMEQCAAAIGWSKAFVQKLKREGCGGFKGSRIQLTDLLRSLEEFLSGKSAQDRLHLQSEGVDSWSELREKWQALSEQEKYAQIKQTTILKSQAIFHLQTIYAIHANAYDRLIEELPIRLAGLKSEQIRQIVEEILNDLRKSEESQITDLRNSQIQNGNKDSETNQKQLTSQNHST
jgi:hypothetical protein